MNFDSSVRKRYLTISGITVPLQMHAASILTLGRRRVTGVLLMPRDEDQEAWEDGNRNVWAFDQNGQQLWKIEALPGVTSERGAYTDISIDENGNLLAYNSIGVFANVDLVTGKVYVAPQRPW